MASTTSRNPETKNQKPNQTEQKKVKYKKNLGKKLQKKVKVAGIKLIEREGDIESERERERGKEGQSQGRPARYRQQKRKFRGIFKGGSMMLRVCCDILPLIEKQFFYSISRVQGRTIKSAGYIEWRGGKSLSKSGGEGGTLGRSGAWADREKGGRNRQRKDAARPINARNEITIKTNFLYRTPNQS